MHKNRKWHVFYSDGAKIKRGLIPLIFYVILFLICSDSVLRADQEWKLIGPGDGDQVTSLSLMTDGTLFLGTDIGGIYKSSTSGESWESMNNGIKNYDITTPVVENYTNPEVLYVGTRGGLYKSTNKGFLWVNKRTGLRAIAAYSLSGSIGSIAIDPFDSQVLYLGYGYRPSSDGTSVVQAINWSQYIYKSTDGGETWSQIGKLVSVTKVNQILPSKTVKNLIWVAADDGLYKSIDGGATLSRVFDKRTLNILIFKNDPKKVLAACNMDGVYSSSDGGITWTPSSTGLKFRENDYLIDRYSILASAGDTSSTTFVLNSSWSGTGGAYKSLDYGKSWTLITQNMPESWLDVSNRMNTIIIDPNDSNKLYMGSSRYVYRSIDGGESWEQLISDSVDSGWTHRGLNVFGHTRFVKTNPKATNTIFVGTTDHGMVRSDNGGLSWKLSVTGMKYKDSVWDIGFCAVDQNQLYAVSLNTASKFSISASKDGGTTWTALTSNLDETKTINNLLVHPKNCNIIYIAGEDEVLKSADGGTTWTSKDIGLVDGEVTSIVFDPSDPTIMYTAIKTTLFKSTDSGDSWQVLWTNTLPITSILILKNNPNIVFAGISDGATGKGGIFRTTDGGKSWNRVLTASRLVSGIVQLPSKPEVLYAVTNDDNFHDESTGSGAFCSTNGGQTWTSINNGLPVLRAFNINVDSLCRVFLSANGSGAYLLNNYNSLISAPLNLRVE